MEFDFELIRIILIFVCIGIILFCLFVIFMSSSNKINLDNKKQTSSFNNFFCIIVMVFVLVCIFLAMMQTSYTVSGDDYNNKKDTYYSNQQYIYFQKLSNKYGYDKAERLSKKAWDEECQYTRGYKTPKCLSEKYEYFLDHPETTY